MSKQNTVIGKLVDIPKCVKCGEFLSTSEEKFHLDKVCTECINNELKKRWQK